MEWVLLSNTLHTPAAATPTLEEHLTALFTQGNYTDILRTEHLETLIKGQQIDTANTDYVRLVTGAAALQLFLQDNWTGPPTTQEDLPVGSDIILFSAHEPVEEVDTR